MDFYKVNRFSPRGEILKIDVPASKSILNRALLLSALSDGTVLLRCGALSADTRAFLDCLSALGIETERTESGLVVHGCGGTTPNRTAKLNVASAGTAARFLTVALAFCGGDYTLDSSDQMKKRPMDEILDLLRKLGVTVECTETYNRFPFRLRSDGIRENGASIDTDKSSQYASALLMAASVRKQPFTLTLTGSRTHGSYVGITLSMLTDFGIPYERNGNAVTVFPAGKPPKSYTVEPDLSGACYFYALALLFSAKVLVKGVRQNSVQGDRKFLSLLERKGVVLTDCDEGLLADGTGVKSYDGFDADLRDFSDQTMTVAALAPFATSPSVLRNVGHIRLQECDRVGAICENLNALGVPARTDGENIFISPAPVTGGVVKTYDDHRVAMAFSLIGLKTGNVTVENPSCCRKTFENYFEILDRITR